MNGGALPPLLLGSGLPLVDTGAGSLGSRAAPVRPGVEESAGQPLAASGGATLGFGMLLAALVARPPSSGSETGVARGSFGGLLGGGSPATAGSGSGGGNVSSSAGGGDSGSGVGAARQLGGETVNGAHPLLQQAPVARLAGGRGSRGGPAGRVTPLATSVLPGEALAATTSTSHSMPISAAAAGTGGPPTAGLSPEALAVASSPGLLAAPDDSAVGIGTAAGETRLPPASSTPMVAPAVAGGRIVTPVTATVAASAVADPVAMIDTSSGPASPVEPMRPGSPPAASNLAPTSIDSPSRHLAPAAGGGMSAQVPPSVAADPPANGGRLAVTPPPVMSGEPASQRLADSGSTGSGSEGLAERTSIMAIPPGRPTAGGLSPSVPMPSASTLAQTPVPASTSSQVPALASTPASVSTPESGLALQAALTRVPALAPVPVTATAGATAPVPATWQSVAGEPLLAEVAELAAPSPVPAGTIEMVSLARPPVAHSPSAFQVPALPRESGFSEPQTPGSLLDSFAAPGLGPLAAESSSAGSQLLEGGDLLVRGGGNSSGSPLLETMNPSQLSERLSDLLRTSPGGRLEVKLRLDPPELGTVRLRVITSGDSVTVQLVARTPEAVEALERRLPELEQALAQNGTQLTEARVDLENSGDGKPRFGAALEERDQPVAARAPLRARPQTGADAARRPIIGPGGRVDVTA